MKNWLRTFEAMVLLIGSLVLAFYVVRERAAVTSALTYLGPFAYPLAIIIFALVASAPFSVTDAIAVMDGVIFGPIGGSIVNGFGIIFAAIIGYYLARRTCALLEIDQKVHHLPHWIRRYRIGSYPFLVGVRIIPGVGGTIATQIAAAFKVPLIVHILAMATIAVPICTVLAIGGDRLAAFVHDRVTGPVGKYVHSVRSHFPHPHYPHFGQSPKVRF